MKLCWIALALLPLAAHADVKVDFVNPEKFSDIRDNTGFTDKAVLKDIEAYLVAQFGKRMPGRDVHISVTDVNLAGEIEPVGGMVRWLRVMRTITSPSMELTYEIRDGEKVVQQGMSKLRDIDYQNGFNSLSSSDPLRYEKHMMDRWMEREFSRTVAPGSPERR